MSHNTKLWVGEDGLLIALPLCGPSSFGWHHRTQMTSRRQEASSSSIWPSADGQPSGSQLGFPPDVSHASSVCEHPPLPQQGIFTQSHFGPEELAGSYLRSGSYVLPTALHFAQRCLDLKAYKKIVSGLPLGDLGAELGCWGEGTEETNHASPYPPIAFYPNIFSYANKKFT